jgi:group I intron endonuclease
MKHSGVYKITNQINGKCYIGSSDNIFHRWSIHKCKLKHNKHDNPHLQNAWNKYGKDHFEFSIVEEVSSERLLEGEQKYLDECRMSPLHFYNIAYNATAPMSGRTLSSESKLKISRSLIGKHMSEETKRKISESRIGMKFSDEHRKNISRCQIGRVPWNKDKRGVQVAWNKGRPWSEESRLKMSRANLGRVPWNKGKRKE